MRKAVLAALAAIGLGAAMTGKAEAAWLGKYEVFGVEEGDMLKMRAGPGTGFVVLVGLPNGAILRVYSCERAGATTWCDVAFDRAPALRGYVSEAYIRQR
ncbi:SH3 domain-containing protein [Sagittula salina]|uniref:SH3 domain-containing protein n=1 Tax=Sagittula salina TaxID=2820268 RepID=A0A940MKD5_9RHOB|nr:SH3 domain-containing protein [Sagittula salina]MBP0483116.1 SH3 domain-containing protein [Sagittula salina]